MLLLPNPLREHRPEAFRCLALRALLFLCMISLVAPARGQQPESQEHEGDEIVVNLAAGRVTIAVVKDGLVIAALENPFEPNTRPPEIVPLSSRSAAVLFGAVNWTALSPVANFANLGSELPRLHAFEARLGPSLEAGNAGYGNGIELIGKALLERLRQLFPLLHGKIPLPPGEPVIELVLANYDQEEGAEVWLLRYAITQEIERGDYWATRVKPPSYTQLWPPEKGQPKTLVEAQYPPEDSPTILELLRKNDPRVTSLRFDSDLADVEDSLLRGESLKSHVTETNQFLRAALTAIASKEARQEIAVINAKTGFDWILQPPPEEKTEPDKSRPAGAPTLRKPPSQ